MFSVLANESWASNTWICHNPKAKYPVNPGLVDDATNVLLQKGERITLSIQPTHVLRSVTHLY